MTTDLANRATNLEYQRLRFVHPYTSIVVRYFALYFVPPIQNKSFKWRHRLSMSFYIFHSTASVSSDLKLIYGLIPVPNELRSPFWLIHQWESRRLFYGFVCFFGPLVYKGIRQVSCQILLIICIVL